MMKLRPRDIIFWIHLIAGCVVGAVIMVMAVTGTIMAFEHQIVEYSERAVRVVEVPVSSEQRLDLNTIVAKAKEHKKNKVAGLTVNADPASSVLVSFGKDGGVYVNPYTGEVLGGRSRAYDFIHTVEDIHRWLGNKDLGRPVTGASVMAFLFLVISGVYLWWPRKWRWSTLKGIMAFNSKATGRARDWNWHNVIGFWAAPLLLTTTVTGAIMAHLWANDLLYRLTGNEPPPREVAQATIPKNPQPVPMKEKPVDFDAILTITKHYVPIWESINVRMPRKADAPIAVYIEEPNAVPVNARSQLSLDVASLNVTKWEPFAEYNLGRKLRVWTKTIHTGEAGGIIGQILALTSAVAAIFLVYTGFAMAWRRFFK